MTYRWFEHALIILLAGISAAAVAAAEPVSRPSAPSKRSRPPSPDAQAVTVSELEQMLANKEYQQLVQLADKQLAILRKASPEAGGTGSDQAKLLLLKGEAWLRLGNAAKAQTAFTDASATQVPELRDEAMAVALLLKRSKGMFYTPRTAAVRAGAGAAAKPSTAVPATAPAQLNVVGDRRAAMEALFRDELGEATSKLKSTRKLRNLQQVFQALSAAQSLRAVEQTATGGTAETDALLHPVAEQARQLMEEAMSGMDGEIARVKERANRTTQTIYDGSDRRGEYEQRRRGYIYLVKVGLRNDDEASLKGIVDACGKIVKASKELRPLLPSERDPFHTIIGRAEHLTGAAGAVLNADYNEWTETGRRAY